jgi:hypothetical protein
MLVSLPNCLSFSYPVIAKRTASLLIFNFPANKDDLTDADALDEIGASVIKDCKVKKDIINNVIKYLFIGDDSKKVSCKDKQLKIGFLFQKGFVNRKFS